eukprot:CAMPEP_0194181832 /NCGR_PEP_ID=MMETSP0154-20130528/21760_1 /TAXON_ID=1049557 /ORGANISM="Thalassiothrix antarctica, Strain L6-D1" /LENGTH=44 /DNA_ID= /DNA_START= /DNA_END= /DNA_ORIENTATION=
MDGRSDNDGLLDTVGSVDGACGAVGTDVTDGEVDGKNTVGLLDG